MGDEQFDGPRGNRFSTYASWAIMKNFARTIPAAVRHRDRFCTSHAEILGTLEDACANESEQQSGSFGASRKCKECLKRLDKRERRIIEDRFGLTRGRGPLTLKQIGSEMGISKERGRQLQTRTMGKLRQAAEEHRINLELAIAEPASKPPSQHSFLMPCS